MDLDQPELKIKIKDLPPTITFYATDILVPALLRRYLDKARQVSGYEDNVEYVKDKLQEFDKYIADNLTCFNTKQYSQKCAHESCPECHGTGVKDNGGTCIHMISCSCSKCNPIKL